MGLANVVVLLLDAAALSAVCLRCCMFLAHSVKMAAKPWQMSSVIKFRFQAHKPVIRPQLNPCVGAVCAMVLRRLYWHDILPPHHL